MTPSHQDDMFHFCNFKTGVIRVQSIDTLKLQELNPRGQFPSEGCGAWGVGEWVEHGTMKENGVDWHGATQTTSLPVSNLNSSNLLMLDRGRTSFCVMASWNRRLAFGWQ